MGGWADEPVGGLLQRVTSISYGLAARQTIVLSEQGEMGLVDVLEKITR